MPGMDTGGFGEATDCPARPAGSSASIKNICSANFQNECPVISNVQTRFQPHSLLRRVVQPAHSVRVLACLLLAASFFCLVATESRFLMH